VLFRSIIQDASLGQELTYVPPAWRSGDEVCLRVPKGAKGGTPGRSEFVLWSPRGTVCISREWPTRTFANLFQEDAAPAKARSVSATEQILPVILPAPAK
jgi:hypothetical protein